MFPKDIPDTNLLSGSDAIGLNRAASFHQVSSIQPLLELPGPFPAYQDLRSREEFYLKPAVKIAVYPLYG